MQPRTSYHAHRERQRRRILDAAERIFDEKGIDRVTMAEIIAACGVRASTMYQYFENKDDIVWALVEETIAAAASVMRRAMESVVGTALKKIAVLLDLMANDLAHRPEKVRFMAQFDAMYARDWPAERLLTVEARVSSGGFAGLSDLIRQGQEDGSLRSDLDPELTMHAVLNTVIGTQRRLASLGARVEVEYGQPVDRLFRETTRVILQGLAASRNGSNRSDRKVLSWS